MLTLPFSWKLALRCYLALYISRLFAFRAKRTQSSLVFIFSLHPCWMIILVVLCARSVWYCQIVFGLIKYSISCRLQSINESQTNLIIKCYHASDQWCASTGKMHRISVRGSSSSQGGFFSRIRTAMKILLSNCMCMCVQWICRLRAQTSVYMCDCQLRKTLVCPMRSTTRKFNYCEL